MHSAQVLIADEDPRFASWLRGLLRKNGYICHIATDAADAAGFLHLEQPDVLIADLGMPGNVNLELIHEATRISPATFSILVTTRPSLPSALEAFGLPVKQQAIGSQGLGRERRKRPNGFLPRRLEVINSLRVGLVPRQ